MPDQDKKITILVPCYNKEKYLPRFFDCLKKQKDKNFKVLFLDDKSKDKSLEMLKNFSKKYQSLFDIDIISLEKNGGLANGRNVLIKNTKTDYFLFADPDDFLKRGAIYHFNKNLKKDDYEILLAKNSLILFGTFPLPNVLSSFFMFKHRIKKLQNRIGLAWVENTSPFAWNKVISTKWFKSLNIDFIVKRNYEDFPVMTVICLKAKKIGYINKSTYIYDINSNGITRQHDAKKFLDIFLNLIVLYERLEKEGFLEDWQINSRAEEQMICNIFVHLFTTKNNRYTMQNLSNYEEAFEIMFHFLENYNVEEALFRNATFNRFVLNDALKNYKKIKILYYSRKSQEYRK